MNLNKKLSDGVWNALGSGAFASSSFLLLMCTTRKFGVAMAGTLGVTLTTAQLMYRVGIFAVRQYQITDIQKTYPFEIYFQVKIITTVLAFLGAGIYVIFTSVIESNWQQFVLIFLFYQLLSINDLYQNHFFQEGRLDKAGKSKGLVISSYLLSFILFLNFDFDLNLILFLSLCISTLISFKVCFKKIRINRYPLKNKYVFWVLKMCFPAFISNFLLTLINSIPKYCVYYYCSGEVSGYYNNIFIVLNIIELIGGFIYYPFIPDITKSMMADKEKARKIVLKIILTICIIDIIVVFGVGCFGKKLFNIVYGIDFSNYIFEIIYNIGICGMCVALISLLYWIPVILKIKGLLIALFMAGTIVAVIFCVFGTYLFGIYGAMIGHSIALGTITILLFSLFIKSTSSK